jgi:ACT domain-containing protein
MRESTVETRTVRLYLIDEPGQLLRSLEAIADNDINAVGQ